MNATPSQTIPLGNGRSIQATFFRPEAEAKAAVILAPAMGVAQKFYFPLASWLAARGFLTATFDYCGIGLSRVPDLRRLDSNIIDWARFDCDAMLSAVATAAPGKRLYWIGHSLGGQLLGLVPGVERIHKIVTVATGSGYWLENAPALRWRAWWLWYVVAPIATPLFGYFPGKRLRKVGDLPREVMNQWRRWCLNPEYAVGVEGSAARASFAAVRAPITALSFTDDEMMSARNIESLHGFYASAPKKMKRLSPADAGVRRIGHFGFFNSRFESSLWRGQLLPELGVESECTL
jgi:predicted alpha/beta hydrolase